MIRIEENLSMLYDSYLKLLFYCNSRQTD